MNKLSAGLIAIALAAAKPASAESNKTLGNADGTCRITVASTWQPGPAPGVGFSGDKKQTATVSGAKLESSFDELKSDTKKLYKDLKVVKDTASELEMVGKSIFGKPEVYRAIVAGDKKFCIVEVAYTAGTIDDVWKIARTLERSK
jgi:hypothetical protein